MRGAAKGFGRASGVLNRTGGSQFAATAPDPGAKIGARRDFAAELPARWLFSPGIGDSLMTRKERFPRRRFGLVYDNAAYRSQLLRHSPNPRILNWLFLYWMYRRKLFLRLSGACGSAGWPGPPSYSLPARA